ncbi:MAG: hypothetical protein GF329_01135 [Candidatus Lokiarchaeota archaeon]|nr:hypothetical protein [Candidatus Lokiarchaeota archaeon]
MVQKILVKCHYCGKKLRIKKEYGSKPTYKIIDGTAKVLGNHIYFFCDRDSSFKEIL